MFGLLNIHKPAGVTSRTVVDCVQAAIGVERIGHAGTLDPLATGVLLIAVGQATRLMPCLHQLSKSYRGEFRLGCRSDTDDATGDVVAIPDPPAVSRAALEAALPAFTGAFAQRPPLYSAVRVGGLRAYNLARAGEAVDLPPRRVVVHRLALVEFDPPRFSIDVECGSGTYIRSLGRDLAEYVGTAAMMTQLVRTRIGPFALSDAVPEPEWTRASLASRLVSPVPALTQIMATAELTPDEAAAVRQGKRLRVDASTPGAAPHRLATVDPSGQLVAIGEFEPARSRFQPRLVFPET